MTQRQTLEVIEMAGPEVALTFHLASRLFPPMREGKKLAQLAIDAMNEGDPDRLVDDGVGRRGPAREIVQAWHLEAFVNDDGEEW